MVRKTGLGKGLDALIPSEPIRFDAESASQATGLAQIPIDSILPNPKQPRTKFDPQELDELSVSIREHGVIQPLLVTKGNQANQFILIAGERRLLAARLAELHAVPAIIREVSEQERVELALIENLQRADLSPLETAEAYRQLSEDYNLPHEQIAKRVGKSRTTITNTLRLLKLPVSVQQAIAEGRITEGHGRALLGLSSSRAQTAALQTILRNDLTVRQTEELVRKLSGEKPPKAPKTTLPAELIELEEQLRAALRTKVTLVNHGKGGTILIHYYSDEELSALADYLTRSDYEK
jgi:ParB family chromosome partitioning protein